MDPKVFDLIQSKNRQCTLRKSPSTIYGFFMDQAALAGQLYERSDKDLDPVLSIRNRLYTILKFISAPNNLDRRKEIIKNQWPQLKADIDALPPAP